MTLALRIDAAGAELARIAQEHVPAAFASSFGAEDMVLLDLIARQARTIGVFTLDTGRLPEETHALIARSRRHFGLPIDVFCPDATAAKEWEAYLDGIRISAISESIAQQSALRFLAQRDAASVSSFEDLAARRLERGLARLELAADRQPGLQPAVLDHEHAVAPARVDRDRERAPAGRAHLGTLSQSARNLARPRSVSGCLASWSRTDSGQVATWAPSRAAWWTCIGWRTEATSTSVSNA